MGAEFEEPTQRQLAYAAGLRALTNAGVRFLVGGGHALFTYLGRWRATKDVGVFLPVGELKETLFALARTGFSVEITDRAWLAKAHLDGAMLDIIFCSYNGLFPVDESWLANGRDAVILGVPCR